MIEYSIVKLVHLGALIFWLGPALGAWLVLISIEDGTYQADSIAAKVSRVFFLMIIVEHVAFVILLSTGLYMAFQFGFMASGWLTQKLYLVFWVVVPLELLDVLLGNWIASKASKKRYAGQSLQRWEQLGLTLYHGAFTKLALVVIPLSVLAIMYLAVSKAELSLFS